MNRHFTIQSLLLILLIFSSGIVSGQKRFGGVTLYTLRNQMDSIPEETLKAVADAGYKYIEVADYREGKFYGMTPAEFKSTLDELGLVPLSAHMGMVNMDNAELIIADLKTAGFNYLVIPVPPWAILSSTGKTGPSQ